MSVHEDLLNNGENNCSFTEDEVDIMCSKDGDDAYRDNSCTTSDRFIRILDLREGTLRGFSGLTRVTEKHTKRQFLME